MRYYKSYRSSRRSRARKSTRKSKYTKPAKLAPSTKKAIDKLINAQIETKQAFLTSGNTLTFFNSGINSTGDYQQILPSISQSGTGDANRQGNEITAQSLNIKGYLKLNVNDTTDSTATPQVIVRMMVVSLKAIQNWEQVSASATWLNSLLRKGQTTTSFAGNLQDLYAPINRDLFTVHHDKRFYLNQSFINAVGVSPPSTVISQDIKNTVKFFNFNVKCRNKKLRYDSNISSINPTNFAPFMILGYCYPDGSSPDTVTTRVGMQYDTTFNYQDA